MRPPRKADHCINARYALHKLDVRARVADLIVANLRDADLRGAKLGGAKFCGTRMPDGKVRNNLCKK